MSAKLCAPDRNVVAGLCRETRGGAIILSVDAIDRKILAVLQAEGRLTITELAQRVSLTVAPCHRRLRELERSGVIRGYRAVIDPAAIGLGFEVLVYVTMDREDASTITEFERGLAAIPQIRHAERLFGDPDYLIRVATADLASYQTLRDERLATLPGVHRVSSTIVMKRIVDDRRRRPAPPGLAADQEGCHAATDLHAGGRRRPQARGPAPRPAPAVRGRLRGDQR
jgi:DNA-binding Lrp family transcriptional regulator